MASVDGAPWKILVIDDDEDDFILIRDMISLEWKECVEVEWHMDPRSVVEKVCSSQYEASLKDEIGGDRALDGVVDAYLSKGEFTLENLKDTFLKVMGR